MANTVEVQILESGPRNAMLLVYLKSDGASGELVNETLISRADLGVLATERLKLERVEYNFSGFDCVLEFASGGITPTRRWVLTEGTNYKVDFLKWGGLGDTSGMFGTGELQITTTGFTSSTDQGSILIKLKKYA